jgi:hypothetical protein
VSERDRSSVRQDPLDERRERGAGEADDGVLLSESAAIASSDAPGGQATSASGGYGTASDRQSSGGTGDGSEDTSLAGSEDQTDWLRDAPGTADEGDR